MKKLVVISGGFHPFHTGHMALYTAAKQAFPDAQIVIGATNAQKDRPFPFKIKQKLAQVSGVPPKDFVEVSRQFSGEDPAIASRIKNPNDTVLIFARSEKDKGEAPLPSQPDPATGKLPLVTRGPNKGKPVSNYLQYLDGNEDNLKPMTQHAYMAYLPTIEFGPGITSASEIRDMWPKLNDKRKTAMAMSLYPETQKNPKLAATVVKLLDAGMGVDVNLQEVFDTKASTATSHWDTSDPDMIKFNFTASNGVEYQLDFLEPYIGPENMSPYDYSDSDEVYENSKFVSFEQITKDMKGGYPVVKQGIEGTGAAAEVFGIVVNAIVQYVKKFKPSLLYFQAAEPGRRALYARMIKRVLPSLPGWTSQTNGGGEFGVYNTKKVKNAMPVQEKMKMGATIEPIEESNISESQDYLEEK